MARGKELPLVVRGDRRDGPALGIGVPAQAVEPGAHMDLAAALFHAARGRLPHHARTLAGILERLDERLDLLAVGRTASGCDRVAQRVRHGAPQVEALDALRRPVGRDLVAAHAPHLLRVGLEEDGEQALAELVGDPVVEALGVLGRERLLLQVGEDAQRRLHVAQVVERLEGLQGIGEVLAVVVDARQARPRDEVVGQDLVPQIHHLLRLGEEPVAADVEQEPAVAGRAADAADVVRIGFDHRRGDALLGEQVGRRQPGRPGADDEDVRIGHGTTSTKPPSAAVRGGRGSVPKALPALTRRGRDDRQ